TYTAEELLLTKGNEFEAAKTLSSHPKKTGDPICDSSFLIGKWKAEGEMEIIILNGNDIGNYNYGQQFDDNQLKKMAIVNEYNFKSDETYSLFTTLSEKSGTVFSKSRIFGKWSLHNGELTLIPTLSISEVSNIPISISEGNNIPMKLTVSTCPEQEIAIQYATSEAWENNYKAEQAKSNELMISQAAPDARELVRKSLNQHRHILGWDSRGYSVMRYWITDDNNRVGSGVITINAWSPAAFTFKRIE
ncbi:MAG: hypothetical protein IKS20_15465, partial [Victivallales bacterium]|nr:hypothetical protein [Victivallales bacterium]